MSPQNPAVGLRKRSYRFIWDVAPFLFPARAVMGSASSNPKECWSFVNANGINMYYESFGSGKPLIFLHGSMGTGKVWKPYIPILSNDFNIILPDVRGHGKTENPDKKIDLHLIADDIVALIEALKLEKPSCVAGAWAETSVWMLQCDIPIGQWIDRWRCYPSYLGIVLRKFEGYGTRGSWQSKL
jgi:pimeloyl-ACP methyl ester carboxylesterase